MSAHLLNQATVRGAFYLGIEGALSRAWVEGVALRSSETAQEAIFGFLNSVPEPVKGRKPVELKDAIATRITVVHDPYKVGLEIEAEDADADQTGDWQRKVAETGQAFANFEWDKITDLRTDNPLSYDGQNYYDTDHVFEDSGTQNNALTSSEVGALNVATPGDPTPEEAADIVAGLVAFQARYVDGSGRPMNRDARRFLLTVPPHLQAAFMTAISANNLDSGETNRVVAGLLQRGYTIDIANEPRLGTSSNVIYLDRIDGIGRRPFIVSERYPLEVDFLGPGTERAREKDRYMVKAKWSGGFAVGEPLHSVKATLS